MFLFNSMDIYKIYFCQFLLTCHCKIKFMKYKNCECTCKPCKMKFLGHAIRSIFNKSL